MAYVHNRWKPRFVSSENVLFSVLLYIKQKQPKRFLFHVKIKMAMMLSKCLMHFFLMCSLHIVWNLLFWVRSVFVQAKFLFLFMQESFLRSWNNRKQDIRACIFETSDRKININHSGLFKHRRFKRKKICLLPLTSIGCKHSHCALLQFHFCIYWLFFTLNLSKCSIKGFAIILFGFIPFILNSNQNCEHFFVGWFLMS